ncbi:MAG: hypothetical protein ACI8RD_004793 [Bacillariaceae sp.]|jgi:hypothetical protein
MASIKDSAISIKSTTSSAISPDSLRSLRDTVPAELQAAIIDLLETCKE